jgi:UDP-N-acetylglucosamine 2-epimerase (non-hydrolysing)
VPVIVPRLHTERAEGFAGGLLRLAGTDPASVRRELEAALAGAAPRAWDGGRAALPNPFGDGQASARIVGGLAFALAGGPRPDEWGDEAALASLAN